MSKLKKIINWFPRPESLTEVSILSGYEIIFYLIIFFACFWIYKSWTSIPVKTIEIECERIDTNQIYNSIWIHDSITKEVHQINQLAKIIGYININVPYSTAIIDTTRRKEHIHTSYEHEYWLPLDLDTNTYKKYETMYYTRRQYIKGLDSLYNIYNLSLDNYCKRNYGGHKPYLDTVAVIYQKLRMHNNTVRIHHPIDVQYDTIATQNILGYHQYFYKMKYTNNLSRKHIGVADTHYEMYLSEFVNPGITEYGGIFDKPSKLDNFDISQCYYRFIIKSSTIDTIKLNLFLQGANELIYVKRNPVEVDGQTVRYNIPGGYMNIIENEVILHVKSKELENIQNSRIFIITAILSGLIVIFLTFIIIFLYRLGRYIRAKRLSKRESKINGEIAEYDNSISDGAEPTEKSKDADSTHEEQVEQTHSEEISSNNDSEKEDVDVSSNNNEIESSKS